MVNDPVLELFGRLKPLFYHVSDDGVQDVLASLNWLDLSNAIEPTGWVNAWMVSSLIRQTKPDANFLPFEGQRQLAKLCA